MEPNTVVCPSCKKNCIPRLHHIRPIFGAFRYLKTQHLCPFCGVAMYNTGGQMHPFGKLLLLFVILPFLMTISHMVAVSVYGAAAAKISETLFMIFYAFIFFWLLVKPLSLGIWRFFSNLRT